MTKSNASSAKKSDKIKHALPLLAGPPVPPAPTAATFPLDDINKAVEELAMRKSASTARYFTFDALGKPQNSNAAVCFHEINAYCKPSNVKGLAVIFQGYGGFDNGDRWRAATEADLYCNKAYPFVQEDGGHYGKESLEWLRALLDPEGPFKTLLPLMMENTPEEVQLRRAFIFPDVSLIPARLTWCFAIASRIGFANARVLWRYLHLLEKGLDRATAVLIASGFEHQIKNGVVTGEIIKSYTGGFLGVDTTAYAGRYLYANPVEDKPFAQNKVGTYNSSEVFKSGKLDMKNLTFKGWDEVIQYTKERGLAQKVAG